MGSYYRAKRYEFDWCGNSSYHDLGPGLPCALLPHEFGRLLKGWNQLRLGGGPFNTSVCSKWSKHTYAWNEVVLDRTAFMNKFGSLIWTLMILDDCSLERFRDRCQHFV